MVALGIQVLLLLCHVYSLNGLPGLMPITYCKTGTDQCKSRVDVYAGKMSSEVSVIPYDPLQFDQCVYNKSVSPIENLGQMLFSGRLHSTNFKINFAQSSTCSVLCRKDYSFGNKASEQLFEDLKNGIKNGYHRNWVADNLPVIVCSQSDGKSPQNCLKTIPLGCHLPFQKSSAFVCLEQFQGEAPDTVILFNHFDFKFGYASLATSDSAEKVGNIISAQVYLQSIDHGSGNPDCSSKKVLRLSNPSASGFLSVTYTYSFSFEEVADASWTSRWDHLLYSTTDSHIHWLSIMNSVVVVVFLTGLVAIVLIRTLCRDVSRYNKLEDSSNEVQDDFGWKLVHGDVFRPPKSAMLLSVLVGSGTQLSLMTLITLFFACFGILSPAHRGAFATCAIAVFVCLGASAGYVSARLYKFFGGLRWKTNVLLTSVFCPGFVVSIFLVLNIVLSSVRSFAAVSFSTILIILSLWLCVSLPLCFLGAFFGFRKQPITVPTRTNQIPRQIPPQKWTSRALPTSLFAGLLPFACIYIQLLFIFSSIWGHQIFFMFGLLFVIFILLLVCVCEITILFCYFQLCNENYKWFWRSFFSGGSTAVYVFLYSVYYFVDKTEYRGVASTFLYFSYTLTVTSLLYLLLGSVGFLACLLFVRKIYSVVKVD